MTLSSLDTTLFTKYISCKDQDGCWFGRTGRGGELLEPEARPGTPQHEAYAALCREPRRRAALAALAGRRAEGQRLARSRHSLRGEWTRHRFGRGLHSLRIPAAGRLLPFKKQNRCSFGKCGPFLNA